jgi:hypothetical protein
MSTPEQDKLKEDKRQERIVTRLAIGFLLFLFLGLVHGCVTGEFRMKFNSYEGCIEDECEGPERN